MKFTTLFHNFTEQSIGALINTYGLPKTVIEIGVFEGNTTFNLTSFLAQQLPEYKHYAIDPHGESDDLPEDVVDNAGKIFKQNLQDFPYKNHIEFLNKTSWEGLMELYNRGVKADFIYVDGDHRASTVLEDLVLSFNLLNIGGIMLMDDCISWRQDRLQDTPKLAVDAFIQCNWDRLAIEQLPNGYQLAIRRIK